jgi:hypothetical protein
MGYITIYRMARFSGYIPNLQLESTDLFPFRNRKYEPLKLYDFDKSQAIVPKNFTISRNQCR